MPIIVPLNDNETLTMVKTVATDRAATKLFTLLREHFYYVVIVKVTVAKTKLKQKRSTIYFARPCKVKAGSPQI